ncbi:MAG TPA: Ig-like domain-containing protein [candidate division Zixibacteria bacterium]|nr:Ig-like domain-containing protein [candidate division Zixibacteria bacterium]
MLVASPALAFLLMLSSCKGDNPIDPEPDTTRPTVQSVSPGAEAEQIARETSIIILFSEAIDSGSVSASTITSVPSFTGSFEVDSNEVTFIPGALLAYGTTYQFTIGTGVTDLAGNELAESYVWSFSIVDDPATTPPQIIRTTPLNNATGVDAAEPISAVFSKTMNPAGFTEASFYLAPAVSGTVSYVDSTAVFTPDDTLDYQTVYTATITTAAVDTYGNHLTANYSWRFTTGVDPYIPKAFVVNPYYSSIMGDTAIIGDTVTVSIVTQHPIGVTRVEFYIDNVYQTGHDDTSEPFEFLWDASGYEIGTVHNVYARAYDAEDRMGISDTMPVYYLWQEIRTDANDDQRVDLKRLLSRSTDTLLELRYEFWENWDDPANDTALDLGIFLDTDQSAATGFTHFTSDGTYINDIGAEYRVIIGAHGYEAWSSIASDESTWIVLGGPGDLAYYYVPADTNVMEIGIRWEEMDFPDAIDLVCNNVFFINTSTILRDWMPNLGSGHLTIYRDDCYLGDTYDLSSSSKTTQTPSQVSSEQLLNPFE